MVSDTLVVNKKCIQYLDLLGFILHSSPRNDGTYMPRYYPGDITIGTGTVVAANYCLAVVFGNTMTLL